MRKIRRFKCLSKYETPEDLKTWKKLRQRQEEVEKLSDWEMSVLYDEIHAYEIKIYKRYIKDCNNDANKIIQDVLDGIDALTKTDYKKYLETQEAHYKDFNAMLQDNKDKDSETDPETKELIEQLKEYIYRHSVTSYESFYYFAYSKIGEYASAFDVWSNEDIGIEPIFPKGLESCTREDAAKLTQEAFKKIHEQFKQAIKAKYIELYPEQAGEVDRQSTSLTANQTRLNYRAIDNVDYPVDKPNKEIWRTIEAEQSGQLSFVFETGRNNKEATVVCSINWDDPNTKITKHLTEWDKLVYIAAASLYDGGNTTVTLKQIYKLMGNDGNPSKTQTKKINDSLTKMGTARLFINNKGEQKAGYNYPPFEYDAPLLPFERLTASINGQETTAIHILKEPPLIRFARERKQITTISLEILKSPINKTDANLRIQDFLIEYISHLKKDKKLSNKITFDTLCKACNVTTQKQKQRLMGKVETYLKHFSKNEWINYYTIDENTKAIKIYI